MTRAFPGYPPASADSSASTRFPSRACFPAEPLPCRSVGQEAIRLLTWNVHKQTDPRWHRDFDRLLDQHRPDIVHLQEARIDVMLAAFSRRAETWTWMASPNLSLPAPASAESARVRSRRLHRGAGAAAAGGRHALGVRRTPARNPEAHAALRPAGPGIGGHRPLPQHPSLNFSLGLAGYGAQLDSLLDAAAAHRGPVIFSGDFNTWSRRRMDFLLRKMDAVGLRRVEFGAEGRGGAGCRSCPWTMSSTPTGISN